MKSWVVDLGEAVGTYVTKRYEVEYPTMEYGEVLGDGSSDSFS